MDDPFFEQFRERPRPAFARSLYTRIVAQPTRPPLMAQLALGLTMIGAAFLVAVALSSLAVRMSARASQPPQRSAVVATLHTPPRLSANTHHAAFSFEYGSSAPEMLVRASALRHHQDS